MLNQSFKTRFNTDALRNVAYFIKQERGLKKKHCRKLRYHSNTTNTKCTLILSCAYQRKEIMLMGM